MALSREVIYLGDFRGGLNLTTQLQTLKLNESPDALNVDFGQRGGFVLRGGFHTQVAAAVASGAKFLGAIYFAADAVLLYDTTGLMHSWDGSTLTSTAKDLSDAATNRMRMASFDSDAYVANGRLAGAIIMQKWDGTTLTTLANTFNDTYTAPDAGDMPLARHVARHAGHMWVADTVESAVRYPHRVRFSHLQNPEDWATADYFDIAPSDDGDPITALVPFRETLLVFKRSGAYIVYGTDKDSFYLEPLSNGSGVDSSDGVAFNAGVCYWFATDGMLMAFNGRQTAPVMDKLRWWSDLGKIKHGGDHRLMWADGRLWMSLEAGSGESVNYFLFVWDPAVGALTRYDPVVTEMFNWVRVDQDADPLFLFESDTNLYRFDRSYSTDRIVASGTVDGVDDVALTGEDAASITSAAGADETSNVRIDGYYRTAWITAGETSSRKRFKRPRVTAAAEGDVNITVDVFFDFNEAGAKRSSDVFVDAKDDELWGTMVWGTGRWGDGQTDTYEFAKLPSAGTGHAVQFKFSSADNAGRWWVDSIALPFRRKRVK